MSKKEKKAASKKIDKPTKADFMPNGTSAKVLEFLQKQKEPVPQSAVDKHLGNERPECWGILDKLVKLGKVTRTKNEHEPALYKAK